MAEAAALTATANKIIQDADSVGTALKTTSLRLRGTDVKVLEEEGLDSEGAVTSKSKLQGKVKALSGVDILTATGEYKSTYEILSEIADVWEKIDDMDQAALLELISGKRNSSVIAAILQNPEELKAAFEDANNASGSALKENEKYLDSIQGKIDQFNNATQAMWSNFLDADVVKGIVQIGTWLIKVIDKVGLLNTALVAIATISMVKNKIGPIAFLEGISKLITGAASKIKGYATSIMSMVAANTAVAQSTELTTVGSLKNAMAVAKVDVANKNAILSSLGLASADKAQAISRDTLTASTVSAMVAEGQLTQAQANTIMSLLGISAASNEVNAARMNELLMTTSLTSAQRGQIITQLGLSGSLKQLSADEVMNALTSAGMAKADAEAIMAKLGLTVANKGLAASFMTLWTAMWPILAVMAGVAVIYGMVKAFDAAIVTTKELGEELTDLRSELSSIESEIESLNSELETTQGRMAELIAMPSLSFVEQEELENLRQTTAELERQVEFRKMLEGNKKDKIVSTSKKYIDQAWNSVKADKKYALDNGVIVEDNFWRYGVNTKDALSLSMEQYKKNLQDIEKIKSMMELDWDSLSGYEQNKYIEDLNVGNEYFGSLNFNESKAEEAIAALEQHNIDIASGIGMVFNDENFDDLKYGMSDDIDAFLDEMYAYQYKWQETKGISAKSSAIQSIFDDTSSQSIKKLKESLTDIANDSTLDDAEKQEKGLKLVSDAINSTTSDYARLKTSMDVIGITADEVARYFVQLSKAPDSSTIESITAQYQKGVDALSKYKDNANAIIAEFTNLDGTVEQITWSSLFDDDGETIDTQISKITHGADETARNEFARIAKAVNDGKMEVENAIKSFGLSGTLAGFKLVEQSITELNTDVFKNLGDDISGLIDTFEELGSVLENVSNSMDLVSQAEAEQAYSGNVSLETALKLMQTTDDWNKVLTITEGNITVNENATENLVKDQLNLVVANLKTSLSTVSAQIAQNNMAASSDNLGKTIEESTTESVRQLAANMEYLSSLVGDFISGNWFADENGYTMAQRATNAKNASLESTKVADTTKTEVNLGEQQANLVAQLNMMGITATIDENGNVTYDGEVDWEKLMSGYSSEDASGGNDTKEDVEDDRFQKEMDYWENRISANQAKYSQLQNEIDLLEAKGQKADASFYEEQIQLENERKWLLGQQKASAIARLEEIEAAGGEGNEQWWDVANTLNDVEGELDDVTSSIVDLQDAIAEIDTYKFEEFGNRLDNLTSKLETIRNLIAPDGEEDWFDDEGNWTESGVAVLGSYLQELETYKQGYAETVDELNEYAASYEGNEAYYETLGIHSEQEWYDKTEELISQQYDFAESISDTEQSVVDMYESSIDAVEEYTETLIDSYKDYIDSVKEALDAERDLYDFKKNVQKQAKDIAEIERRIASLSGSTNAADIAERRKLEAQLYESRESLNDTYYDHAKDSQNEALDSEAAAYEESMTKFVEGLRVSLEEATVNMDEFLMGVTSMVMYNADTVLTKYQETNLPLTDELTNPWEEAKEATSSYSGNALALMNEWTKQGGFFTQFNTSGTTNLTSPWGAGTTAATNFRTDVAGVMSGVVSNISSNVKTASSALSDLYKQIQDTENRAANANVTVAGAGSNSGSSGYVPPQKKYYVTAFLDLGSRSLSVTKSDSNAATAMSLAKTAILGEYEKVKGNSIAAESAWQRTWRNKVKYTTQYYAKGTTSTSRDAWAITDEPRFGDELVLVPGKDGNLSFMRKGTGVVPADLTANLMEWGQFTPDSMNLGNGVNVNMINNAVNKPEFNFAFDALVKAENITEETLPAVKKLVTQELNRFTKELNYALKGKGAR